MTTKTHQIIVDDLVVDVVRKNIKNLRLAVYPPEGRLQVSAPLRVNDEAVRQAVLSKLPWIRKQRAKFAGLRRQAAHEYVSHESHYFQGNRYLLNVVEHDGRPRVTISNHTTLDLVVPPASDRDQRERVLMVWYRQQLKQQVPPLLAKWEAIIGVQSAEWHIKHMKTRWGTCNPRARRIWLNLELAKKPVQCLEYVIVHELVHLLARKHDARFKAYMDQFIPQWRLLREELNRAPMGYTKWEE